MPLPASTSNVYVAVRRTATLGLRCLPRPLSTFAVGPLVRPAVTLHVAIRHVGIAARRARPLSNGPP